MTDELYDKFLEKFTDDQLDWLVENVERFPGNTDEEIIANAARLLYEHGEWTGDTEEEAKENGLKLAKLAISPNIAFDLHSLAQAAGFSDRQEGDTKISAAEQFLDAYFGGEKDQTTRELWRAGIADKYGDGSWDKAKKVLRRAEIDRMNADIAEARRKEIDPTFSEASIPKWLSSAMMGLFTPRRKQAYLEGRDPRWQETLGDLGQAALYSAPVGKIVQGTKAIMGPGIASTVLGNLVAQGVAPTAVVGMDKVLGNRDYTFNEGLIEALIGTGTNLGVNKGLAALATPAYQLGMQRVRGEAPQWLMNFLDGVAPVRERAQEKLDDAVRTLKAHYGETSGGQLHRIARGKQPVSLPKDELERVRDLVEVHDYIKGGANKINLTDVLEDYIKSNNSGVREVVKNIGKDPLRELDTQTIDQWKKPLDEAINKVISKTPVSQQTDALKRALPFDPELLSLFYRRTPREVFNDIAGDAMTTWAVNRYGSDKDASLALSATGLDASVNDLRKEQERIKQERPMKASAARILGDLEKAGTELTDEDIKWLKKIEQNPGMVQGYGEGSKSSFRNWMILRGSDLLSGTPLYRPTFSVE